MNKVYERDNYDYIYRIYHIDSGKSYIGLTDNIDRRIEKHLSGNTHVYSLSKDLKNYGSDSFSFDILERCEKSILAEREVFWISALDTFLGNGYNGTSGGNFLSYVANKKLRAWRKEQDLTLQDIADDLECTVATVLNWEKGSSITRKLRNKWKEVYNIDIEEEFGIIERKY